MVHPARVKPHLARGMGWLMNKGKRMAHHPSTPWSPIYLAIFSSRRIHLGQTRGSVLGGREDRKKKVYERFWSSRSVSDPSPDWNESRM
jgi:hypothetical protein